jgi:hypothetical protein
MTRVHDPDVYTYSVYMITLRDAHIYTYVYIYIHIWRIRLVCGARAYKWPPTCASGETWRISDTNYAYCQYAHIPKCSALYT